MSLPPEQLDCKKSIYGYIFKRKISFIKPTMENIISDFSNRNMIRSSAFTASINREIKNFFEDINELLYLELKEFDKLNYIEENDIIYKESIGEIKTAFQEYFSTRLKDLVKSLDFANETLEQVIKSCIENWNYRAFKRINYQSAFKNIATREELIDNLLIYLKNRIEKLGLPIKNVTFKFNFSNIGKFYDEPLKIIEESNDLKDFKTNINYAFSDEDIELLLKYCITHAYIQGSNNSFRLTDLGFSRATSSELEKSIARKEKILYQQNIHISDSKNIEIKDVSNGIKQDKHSNILEKITKCFQLIFKIFGSK